MISLRQQALKLLARREHSRAELAQKLSATADKEDVNSVLDQLEQTGALSDQRMAAAYLRSHAARFGLSKLRMNLRAKGVSADLIAQCLAQGSDGDTAPLAESEEERALAIWQRKFARAPADKRAWAQQARFLQSRGFSGEVIRRLLKAVAEERP